MSVGSYNPAVGLELEAATNRSLPSTAAVPVPKRSICSAVRSTTAVGSGYSGGTEAAIFDGSSLSVNSLSQVLRKYLAFTYIILCMQS